MRFKISWLKFRYIFVIALLFSIYLFASKFWIETKKGEMQITTESKIQESCDFDSIQDYQQSKAEFLKSRNLQANTKVILLYTGLFFHPWWWNNEEKDLHRYTHAKNCIVKDCYFTYDKKSFNIADAVIFHGVDINKPYCYRKLSAMRPTGQRWIFFMHESPLYTIDLRPYNGLFNLTMTYMRKSEIYVPYYSFEHIKESSKSVTKRNFAFGKTGKVVWVVSHCGLIRDDYALELEKYIRVDVYGGCGDRFVKNMGRCSDWGTQCEDEIKKYKFYLSFENCFCEDYITEKYWEKGLKYGLIPIIMGGISDQSNIIEGSYIDVNKFDSIRKLADYLHFLDRNETAYNKYFDWRYKYKVTNGADSFCEVCKVLHDPTIKDKSYDNLSDFWSVAKNCDVFNWKIKNIKSQIAKSKFQFQ